MGSGRRSVTGARNARTSLPKSPRWRSRTQVGNAVEAAYRRGDLLDKRRALMEAWSTFLTTGTSAPAVKLSGLAEFAGADMPKVVKALTALEVNRLSVPGHARRRRGAWPLPSGPAAAFGEQELDLFGSTSAARGVISALAGIREVSLAQAREAARGKRQLVRDGVDPIARKRAAESARRAAAMKKMTFAEAAARYIAIQEPGWRNAKHAWQWRNSLDRYVIPKIGRLDVGDIGITQVLDVLEPIWRTTTETASRIRGRIELILAWADKRAERERLNPARWRGHLDTQLPRPSKVARPKHHGALALAEMGLFMRRLRGPGQHGGTGSRVRHPDGCEVGRGSPCDLGRGRHGREDLDHPAERMKGGREHRVPLSDGAMSLLRSLARVE